MPPSPPAAPPHHDPAFSCGDAGPHVAEVDSADALYTAVDDASITCIKLAPLVYELSTWISIGGAVGTPNWCCQSPRVESPLAIVALEGQATLNGGGSTQLIYAHGSTLLLANIVLRNAKADQVRIP